MFQKRPIWLYNPLEALTPATPKGHPGDSPSPKLGEGAGG
jgi:hypothetical protein